MKNWSDSSFSQFPD